MSKKNSAELWLYGPLHTRQDFITFTSFSRFLVPLELKNFQKGTRFPEITNQLDFKYEDVTCHLYLFLQIIFSFLKKKKRK